MKANVILISSVQGKTFTFKMMRVKPSLKTTKVSQKKKTDKELIKVFNLLFVRNCPSKMSLENLADSAFCCRILVNEDSNGCQSAWKNK